MPMYHPEDWNMWDVAISVVMKACYALGGWTVFIQFTAGGNWMCNHTKQTTDSVIYLATNVFKTRAVNMIKIYSLMSSILDMLMPTIYSGDLQFLYLVGYTWLQCCSSGLLYK